jgi:hypothetical protein
MFVVQAPIVVIHTAEAKEALGSHLKAASLDAYRAIAQNGKGLEIAHLQFEFRGLTLAICSRLKKNGFIEIEVGIGNPSLTSHVITNADLRKSESNVKNRRFTAQKGSR